MDAAVGRESQSLRDWINFEHHSIQLNGIVAFLSIKVFALFERSFIESCWRPLPHSQITSARYTHSNSPAKVKKVFRTGCVRVGLTNRIRMIAGDKYAAYLHPGFQSRYLT